MKEEKTLKVIDPDYYFEMLALSYRIRPEEKEVFIKRMKAYNLKLHREEMGGNEAIHKMMEDE